MPYSFTQIERRQSGIIWTVFGFLIFWYFAFFWLTWFLILNSYGSQWPVAEQTLFVLLAALGAGGIHWFFSTSNCINRTLRILRAVPPSFQDDYHQRFRRIVEEVSAAAGGRAFEAVISPSFSLNAFSLEDFSGRCVIGVTEGLLARLNRAQLEAVTAQQAAYIVSGDCRVTTLTSSLSEFYSAFSISRLEDIDPDGELNGWGLLELLARIARLPGFLWLILILWLSRSLSRILRMFLSRQRHERADAVAVRLCRDPLSLAQALYVMAFRWRGSGLPDEQLEAIFIVHPSRSRWEEHEGVMAELFATHPPVRRRLKVLMDMAHADADDLPRMRDLQDALTRRMVNFSEGGMMLPRQTVYSGLVCPHCGIPLEDMEYEGTEVLKCRLCHGVLAHESSVGKIIIRRDAAFPEPVRRSAAILLAQEADGRTDFRIKQDPLIMLPCPVCRQDNIKMIRQFYTLACLIEVDRCVICRHCWFDGDELEILQCLVELRTRKSSGHAG